MTSHRHEATAASGVLAEHDRHEQRAIADVEGTAPFARQPMSAFGAAAFDFVNALNRMSAALRPITVSEVADVVVAIEDDPHTFAERFINIERRVKLITAHYDRLANVVQGLIDVPERLDRAERTLSRLDERGADDLNGGYRSDVDAAARREDRIREDEWLRDHQEGLRE